jgi:16S rRNA (cytidine1402-2'-O)-methyltransferase
MSLGAENGEPIDPARRSKPAPGLYIVATPIGNAEDITLRALRVLAGVDVIACEDTRVSVKLLRRHAIATQRVAYHDHNAEMMRPKLLARLEAGESVALISDAGTPLVSDPGYKLVRDAVARGIKVTVLPGACAPIAALVLSALPADHFFFAGFLPAKQQARRRMLETLKPVPATLLFLESPARLAASLADMAAVLGDRPAAVARELTKLFEEVKRAPLKTLAASYAAGTPPKGEIVVVVGSPLEESEVSADALDAALTTALAAMSLKDASLAVAAATGLPRRAVYARALALAGRAE